MKLVKLGFSAVVHLQVSREWKEWTDPRQIRERGSVEHQKSLTEFLNF